MSNREKEVPSTLEVAALDLRSTYNLSHEGSSGVAGAIGAVGMTLVQTSLKPLFDRRYLGPNSFQREAFLNVRYDIACALAGKEPSLSDHLLKANPEEYTEQLLKGVRENDVEPLLDTSVGKLTQYVLAQLEKKQLPNESANRYFGDWLEATIDNRKRTKERKILSTSELDAIYSKEGREMDVQLVLAETNLRTRSVLDYYIEGDDFGKYIRQLEALKYIMPNWEKGKIDIPREVLSVVDLDAETPVDDVKLNQSVFEWKWDTVADIMNKVKQGVYELEHYEKSAGTKASKKFLARHAIEVVNHGWQ
jgi:hypothetical protein